MKKSTREKVMEKFDSRCAYCGQDLPQKGWHVDHIIPLLRGHENNNGDDSIKNLNPACRRCNTWKGGMSLDEFRAEIGAQAERLRRDSAGFRLAEDFGAIIATSKPVVFLFDKI